MLLRHYFFCILLFYITTIYSIEYIYPVASLHNGEIIILIHQLSSKHIELLQWNTQTNTMEQILWSLFNPAGFQLLPDNLGFSFIDNGRLRIKAFNKRSPKAIDFDEPIFNINSLQWINSYSCYCSAQQGDDYALFELYDDGAINAIASYPHKDCIYPQKIDLLLFYIERDKSTLNNTVSHIMQAHYPEEHNNNAALSAHMIIDFQNSPIIFLNMQSHQEGFVIEHSQTIDTADTTISFVYHHFIKNNDIWDTQKLFSFTIPSSLLIQGTDESLYESILPLLPRVIHNKVYFVTCTPNNNTLEPYCYDMTTKTNNKIILEPTIQGHCFVPMLCGNKFYCGGTQQVGQPLIYFLT